MGEWIDAKIELPENYNDKKIKLSDGNILTGYYDVKSKTWCGVMPIPLLKKSDNRTVISWLEMDNCDSLLNIKELIHE
jgi:hypothetical protein